MSYRPRGIAPLLFLFLTILTQVIGAGVGFLIITCGASVSIGVLVASVATTLVAKFLELPPPWLVLNGILPLSAAVTTMIDVPHYVFLAPFLALALVYAPAFWTRVPYYPTSRESYPLILAELPVDREFTFVDVGCGFGDLLFFLSTHRPRGRFVGVEIGLVPMLYARAKAFALRRPTEIRCQSMWKVSFSDFDFVYAFLSPAPMPALWAKLSCEMRTGTTFISNTFPVPAKPDQTIRAKDERRSELLLFRMSGTSVPQRRETKRGVSL